MIDMPVHMSPTGPAGSIIMPAHNEAAVIPRSLRELGRIVDAGIELVIVANGCTDATAEVARAAAPWAVVIETSVPSKTYAIRLGENAATCLPRLYLDADVRLTRSAALSTLAALASGAVAARPPILYDSSRATWPVRRYYDARRRMPSLHQHAWGAGVYGLSAEARARFDEFPDVVGDDLWVDGLLTPGEFVVVDSEPVVVTTPRDSHSLVRILRRGAHAKAQPPSAGTGEVPRTAGSTARDLLAVARAGPQGLVNALTYGCFAAAARLTERRSRGAWERDSSSRA